MKIKVTDHALIRYIERVKGINLDDVRAEIARQAKPAIKAGAASYFDGECTWHLQGAVVVTVVDARVHAKPRRQVAA
jgi:hypothetical protein